VMDQDIVNEIAYWFLYGLKLGRVKEHFFDIKAGRIDSVEVCGTTMKEFVYNYNDVLGQKV